MLHPGTQNQPFAPYGEWKVPPQIRGVGITMTLQEFSCIVGAIPCGRPASHLNEKASQLSANSYL